MFCLILLLQAYRYLQVSVDLDPVETIRHYHHLGTFSRTWKGLAFLVSPINN